MESIKSKMRNFELMSRNGSNVSPEYRKWGLSNQLSRIQSDWANLSDAEKQTPEMLKVPAWLSTMRRKYRL